MKPESAADWKIDMGGDGKVESPLHRMVALMRAEAFAAGERKGRIDAWKSAYKMACESQGLGVQVAWKIQPIIDRLEREEKAK